jgi:hypothetical protein
LTSAQQATSSTLSPESCSAVQTRRGTNATFSVPGLVGHVKLPDDFTQVHEEIILKDFVQSGSNSFWCRS